VTGRPLAQRRDEREQQIARESDHAIRHLQLVDRHEGPTPLLARFSLRAPGSSLYWSEVVTLRGGSVLVHGDIGVVVFTRSPYPHWRQLLTWIATANGTYACEKAEHGCTLDARVFDPMVARSDVAWHRRQGLLEREAARDLWSRADDETAAEWAGRAYRLTKGDFETSGDMGWCVGPAVLMAQAVLRRLLVLLDADTQPTLSGGAP